MRYHEAAIVTRASSRAGKLISVGSGRRYGVVSTFGIV